MVARLVVPHTGIFMPWEVSFLRSVVRDALEQNGCPREGPAAWKIARTVFDAYIRGISARDVLLRISAKRQPPPRAVQPAPQAEALGGARFGL